MIYSVWNTRDRRFDYYETPGVGPTHAEPATHVKGAHAMGATPAEAAWPLPPGARKVGAGNAARGRIAQPKGFASMGAIDGGGARTVWIVGGLLAAAALARRYLR